MIITITGIDLQLFADGASAEGSGDNSGEESAATARPQAGENTDGTQEPPKEHSDAGSEKTKRSFKELIESDYKEDFQKTVSDIVGKRISSVSKKLEGAQGELQKQEKILARLFQRYGATSIEELNEALDNPENVYDAAEAAGMSADTFLEMERLRTDKTLKDREEQRAREESKLAEEIENKKAEIGNLITRWNEEASKVKEIYPDFDINTEIQNPDFRRLITSKNPEYNISMLDAYRLLHYDGLMQQAEKNAQAKMAQNAQARAQRPTENGLGAKTGSIVGSDVKSLSKKDRAEIAKRAARGERITF